ncbi:hypothetical protein FQN60_016784, partial [Etheostoma spectabile]
IDYCTRWAQAYAIKSKSAAEVTKALAKLVEDKPNTWDQYLDAVMFGLRTKKQLTTQFSPYYLMFGREARYPSEVPEHYQFDGSFEDDYTNEEVAIDIERHEKIMNIVDKNVDKLHARTRGRLSKKEQQSLQVGDSTAPHRLQNPLKQTAPHWLQDPHDSRTPSSRRPLTGYRTLSSCRPLSRSTTRSSRQPHTDSRTPSSRRPLTGYRPLSSCRPLSRSTTRSSRQPHTDSRTPSSSRSLSGFRCFSSSIWESIF